MHVAHNVAMICKRCLVSGKVQGVFYRASTARRARELDLSGYAMNLTDGRVEVLVYGEPENVLALCEWLWEGPPAARVNDVEVYDAEITDIPEGFITR